MKQQQSVKSAAGKTAYDVNTTSSSVHSQNVPRIVCAACTRCHRMPQILAPQWQMQNLLVDKKTCLPVAGNCHDNGLVLHF
jgi:hypothetical protein